MKEKQSPELFLDLPGVRPSHPRSRGRRWVVIKMSGEDTGASTRDEQCRVRNGKRTKAKDTFNKTNKRNLLCKEQVIKQEC